MRVRAGAHQDISPPSYHSLSVSHLSNTSQPAMEATIRVRRRSNSTLALKAPIRSRCHSVHIASLTPRLATHQAQRNEENRSRVSTFSVRSRASSMSSFSSGSSGSSSTISSPTSGYNTETFWNRYRRAPDTSIVNNFLRKYKMMRLVNRDDREDNKYHSAADLLNYN